MVEPLADQVIGQIKQAAELYHRLMLVVAPAGAGKTTALQDVQDRAGAPLINVNLDLSRRMLDLTERQRALWLPRLLPSFLEAVFFLIFPNASFALLASRELTNRSSWITGRCMAMLFICWMRP